MRTDRDGTLLIGQPSHAWISGQLARAWGNERFAGIEPFEEVCLAAEQHDIGMADWDPNPERNPDTGLPRSFVEMPLETHLDLWGTAPRRLLRQSRYAALLVSMHGMRLYQMRDLDRMEPAAADAVREYIAEQRTFQAGVLASLRDDAMTTACSNEEPVARNSQLVWVWDYLSLAICLDWAPCSTPAVPASGGEQVELALRPGKRPNQVIVDPWPLRRAEPFTVRCEGQRLHERYDTDEQLARALSSARWETVEVELTPQAKGP